jgi:endonuclease/exonuclease/phosphatase (EEP) superfamily protein YafD
MSRTIGEAPPRCRSSSWPGRVLRGAAAATVGGLVLLPDLLGLDQSLPFAVLVAFRPHLAVATAVIALLVVLRWRRARPEAVAVVLVSLVAVALVVPKAVARLPSPESGPAVSVLTFNVDRGGADVSALADTIRRSRPDVVVLPEAAARYEALLTRAIPDLGYRPYLAARPGAPDVNGVVVLSAASMGPLVTRVIAQSGFDPWLELTGGRLGSRRLVAVHISAPVTGKIGSWSRELAQLQTWCGPGAGPVVLAGDFNATLDHSGFRSGTRGCRDAGAQSGQGLIATWNAAWPRWFGAQIDHVLTGGGPEPTGMTVLDLPGSDHRAVLASVRLVSSAGDRRPAVGDP